MEHPQEQVFVALQQMQVFAAQFITAMLALLARVVMLKIVLQMINVEHLREPVFAAHQHSAEVRLAYHGA